MSETRGMDRWGDDEEPWSSGPFLVEGDAYYGDFVPIVEGFHYSVHGCDRRGEDDRSEGKR